MSASSPATGTTDPIRPLHDPADLRACQEIQRRAWGIVEDGYLIPVATLAAASAYGGLVLGAFRAGALVGFSFAFRGVYDGTPILYSQLTGVLPEAQGGGTGRQLKFRQREWARAQGLPLVAWAFDPLQAMNAHYNLNVLGAAAVQYHANFYGARQDALNPGLPTDRLLAVWPTADPLPTKPEPQTDGIISAVRANQTDGVWTALSFLPAELWGDTRYVGIEIPGNLRDFRAGSPTFLAEWQAAMRSAFTDAFAAGYRAVSLQRAEGRTTYLLTREG